jgi:tetratricopeptide (TPR) repeat protein
MRRTLPSWLLLLGLATLPSGGWAASAPWRAKAEVDLAEGLSALDAGDNAAAVDWFGQAASLAPDEGSARYWRGIALLRLGRAREAAAEIEASLAAHNPPEVDRERVLTDLAAARKAAEGVPVTMELPEGSPAQQAVDDRGLWDGAVGLSAAADTNPNLLSNDLSVPAPGPGDPVVRGGDSDGLARVDLRLGIYPFHTRETPNLSAILEIRRAFHFDFGYLDLGLARGAVQLAFGSNPQGFLEGSLGSARIPFGGGSRFAALFQAGGAVYRLGSEPYFHTVEGAAAFSIRETPATATRFDLGYADRRFPGGLLSDPRRNGQDLSLGLSQLFYFGGWNRSLRLGVRGVDRRAGPEFTATFLEANGELIWPLRPRWSLVLEGRAREDHYDRRESNLFNPAGPRRRETTLQAAPAIVWEASDRLRWTVRGAYTRRNSNVDLGGGLPDLGYRRLVVSAGLSWEL